jgi:hypothetical protein
MFNSISSQKTMKDMSPVFQHVYILISVYDLNRQVLRPDRLVNTIPSYANMVLQLHLITLPLRHWANLDESMAD